MKNSCGTHGSGQKSGTKYCSKRETMLKQECKTEMETSEDVTACKNNTQSEYIVSNEI